MYQLHVVGHFRANAATASEKEVGHMYFVLYVMMADGAAPLIKKTERADGMRDLSSDFMRIGDEQRSKLGRVIIRQCLGATAGTTNPKRTNDYPTADPKH